MLLITSVSRLSRPMLNLEPTSRRAREPRFDPRMTLPPRSPGADGDRLLSRRDFVLVPWIAISVAAAAYVVSEALRPGPGVDARLTVGGCVVLAALAALVALLQDRPFGYRHLRSLAFFTGGGAITYATIAAIAVADVGLTSVVFTGLCPLAAYGGFIAPRRWRAPLLGALCVVTAVVQVVTPAALPFDAVIVWLLIVAAWGSGVVVGAGHARLAKIVRLLARFDRATRSLNRRGFLEQLEAATTFAGGPDDAVALLTIEADLARVAALDGDDGRRVLAWIGTAVPAVLPTTAEFGRLGDAEFGILLPGSGRAAALRIAQDVRQALEARVPTVVGLATSETRGVEPSDLLQVADAARSLARRDHLGVHALVAGTVREPGWQAPVAAVPARRPTLRYADMRATGRVPRVAGEYEHARRLAIAALLIVALSAVPVFVKGLVVGGDGFAHDLLRYGAIPWMLGVFGLAAATHRWAGRDDDRIDLLLFLLSSVAIAVGVGDAALADGGLTSPMAGAFFIKLLFDATVSGRRLVLASSGILLTGWLAVAVLGPSSALWAVPFHVAVFGGCLALGTIGRRAMDDAADRARSAATIDDLTQFSNREGFVELAHEAFYRSATSTGQPFAIITLRLHGLRTYNETHGYAAGDLVLGEVADLLETRIPAYHVIGRTGATEFSAAVMVSGTHDGDGLARDLAAEIGRLLDVTVGVACCPQDGATTAALMTAAERAAGSPRTAVV